MPLVVHDPVAGPLEVPPAIEAAGAAAIAEFLTKKSRAAAKRPAEPRPEKES